MPTLEQRLDILMHRMELAGMPRLVTEIFLDQYRQLDAGATGHLTRSSIRPVEDLPHASALLGYEDAGRGAMQQVLVLKLNGGLGTSMGLDTAKSLLPVKGGLRFIDIIARQNRAVQMQTGAKVPLLLMDTSATQRDTLQALSTMTDLDVRSFLQHVVPKILVESLLPVTWPADPSAEWCPPGHGDLYAALQTTGTLRSLLAAGYRYLFVSNADNLGAIIDPGILGYLVRDRIPFLMEVADRTPADRKGGHLAMASDGGLLLRELAQCPAEELEEFQDITRYKFFNTNNLWVDLEALERLLAAHGGRLPLPLIRNLKTVDPRLPSSPKVYQLETAMGTAIALFAGAQAVRVPRERFAPVKTTDDLLALWSDAYILTEDARIVLAPSRDGRPPLVTLDKRHFGMLTDLQHRFSAGPPSLVGCRSFTVEGDVSFGKGVVCRGDVRLVLPDGARRHIADGTVLEGNPS